MSLCDDELINVSFSTPASNSLVIVIASISYYVNGFYMILF